MDGLRINHEEQKIILTRQFAKESENDSSPAYRRLVAVRKEFDYKVEVRSIKKTAKESYKGLNSAYIERYVKKYGDKDGEQMKTYNKLIELSECHSIRFPTIKQWFLREFPEVKTYGLVELEKKAA